jgi:hypothetical protein
MVEIGGVWRRRDCNQEIDFELSGYCREPTNPYDARTKSCGTAASWTAVFENKPPLLPQIVEWSFLLPKPPRQDTTTNVYRYKIDWQKKRIVWYVDTGTGYLPIRTFTDTPNNPFLEKYCESIVYAFISFWHGDFLGSTFAVGEDAPVDCGASGKCYQAFYFGRLRFTPSVDNKITRLGS